METCVQHERVDSGGCRTRKGWQLGIPKSWQQLMDNTNSLVVR